jgi:hypothetical protein
MIKAAQPQVLILPAGLALEEVEGIKSIKNIVVVDIGSAPHMDWAEEEGKIPVQTWTDMLEASGPHHPPADKPAAIAFQSFTKHGKSYKPVNFTQQVDPLLARLIG